MIGSLDFSPDGKSLAVGDADGVLRVVEPRTGAVRFQFTAHSEGISFVAWSPTATTKVRVLATIRGSTCWQLREVSGGSGYCSQNDLRAHFGRGDATTVETIRIQWPSGIAQELRHVPANQFLTITEQQPGVTAAPHLTVALATDGEVQLTLSGQANLRHVFEASTNLTRWTKIAVRTNLIGTVDLADGAAAKLPERFYRAWAP